MWESATLVPPLAMRNPEPIERALRQLAFAVFELDRGLGVTRLIGSVETGQRVLDVLAVELVCVDDETGHRALVETRRSVSREPEEMIARELFDRVSGDLTAEHEARLQAGSLSVGEWSVECMVFGSRRLWGAAGALESGGEVRVTSVGFALEEVGLRAADLSAYRSV